MKRPWQTREEELTPHRKIGFPVGFNIFCVNVEGYNFGQNSDITVSMNRHTSYVILFHIRQFPRCAIPLRVRETVLNDML